MPHSLVAGGGDAAYFEAGLARLRLGRSRRDLFPPAAPGCPGPTWPAICWRAAVAARLLGARARGHLPGRGFLPWRRARAGAVAEMRGVRFFNDSKATNVDAARKALEAFDGPVIAILGGRYKGGDFETSAPPCGRAGRPWWPSGEAAGRVEESLAGVVPLASRPDDERGR